MVYPAIVALLLSLTSISSVAQGPGAAWQNKRCISFSTPTTMANYQVKLVLTNNEYTNMNSNGSDLRFYDGSNNNCPYWIEKWDLSGQSIVWVKVVANNTSQLTMYYGNASAPAATNANNTFDWFDGFDGTTLNTTIWNTNTTGGTITVGGGNVTLNNTTGNSVYLYTKNPGFTTASTDFYLETKFNSPDKFYRNRFYASATSGGGSPLGYDYGYFRNDGDNGNEIYFSGWTGTFVYEDVDYISQWALSDNNTTNNYTWNTLNYPDYSVKATHAATYNSDIRHLMYGVTESKNTSTVVDWVRVRKRQATEPVLTVGPQQPLILTSDKSVICQGESITFMASTNGFTSFQFYVNGSPYGSASPLNAVTIPNLNNGDKVKVTSLACGTTVTSNEITVVVNPTPNAVLGADKTTICAGETILFTAVPGSNPAGTIYDFRVDGSTVQSSPSNTFSTNAITNGQQVTVVVTTPSTCSATSNAITITVHALPTGTVTSSDADNKVCFNTSVTFTATPGYISYEFFVDGVSQGAPTASNTFTTSGLSVGLHTIGVKAKNSNNCFGDLTPLTFTVYALPTGTITVAEASGTPNDNIICSGATVTFTAPSGNSNYKFYLNGTGPILNGDQASNTYSTTSLNNGDYVSVVVTNSSGCTTTLNSPNITVNALPSGTLSVSKNPICAGETVIFTATGGTFYKFYLNGILVQQGPSNTYSPAPSNLDIVSVEARNANGCIQNYPSITMTVNPLPTGTMTFSENSGTASNDGIICFGDAVTFIAPSGYANYDFTVNGSTVQNNGSHIFTTSSLAVGTNTIKVNVGTDKGCSALLNTITITVNALPTVAAITGTFNFCANVTSQLSDATPGGTWSSSNPSAATVNATGLVTGVSAGTTTITYTVTNANGCTDSKSALVTIYAIPAPGSIGGTKSVCAGGTQKLTNSLPGGTWSSSNNGIATVASDGTVTGVSAGTVTITYSVTNGNGCTVSVSTSFEVFALPVVAPISGLDAFCNLSTKNYTDATPGGTWSSSNPAVATINATTGDVTGISAGTVTIYYTVVNGNGCTTTVSKNITIYALPNITLTGPNPICPNTTGTYTTEAGMSDYTWNFTNGTVIAGGYSTDNYATVSWGAGDPKHIFVNYTDGNGCQAEKQVTVTSVAANQPVITGTNDLCQNSQAVYTTGAGGTVYSWTITGGTVVSGGGTNDNTVTVQWNTAGNQSVQVNYTNTDGCRATSPTVYNVTVHPLPLATVSAAASEVCQNSASVLVTFTGSNGTAPYTFQYKVDGGATQTISTVSGNNSTTITIPTNIVTTHVVQLVNVSDAHSCSQNQNGSTSVQINPLPGATIGGTTSVCQNATQPNITFTGSNGTAPYTFTYNINGGSNQTITTVSGNSITIAAPTGVSGVYQYNLVSVSDKKGCTQVQTGTATVTINPLPTASIAVNTTEVCRNGTQPIVTFTGANGTGPYTFTYQINGVTQPTIQGNPSVSVNVPTGTAGTFVYSLVSVHDASSTSCSQPQTGSVSIVVDPASVGGSTTGNATVCSGTNSGNITLSGYTGNIIRWEYSTNGGSTWNTISNTTSSLTYTNITQTTLYRAVVQSGVCSISNSGTTTITVSPVSVGGTISGSTTVCSGTNSGTLTLSGYTGNIVRWEYSTDGGGTWINIANITTSQNYTNLTQTRQYRAVVQSTPCSSIYSGIGTITVNPLPDAAISGTVAVCQDGTSPVITFTGSNATGPYTFTYTINGATQPTIQGNPTVTINAPTTTPGTYTYAITKVQAATTCQKNVSGISATVTVNPKPASFNVSPATAEICQGSTLPMIAAGPITNSSVTSGPLTVNQQIPRNNNYLNSGISVSGIPAGAIITNVDVTFNIGHNRTSDLRIFLQAPNGSVIKLVDSRGNGANFTNTTITSRAGFPTIAGNGNPFTNTYNGNTTLGNIATTTNWSSLYSITNGIWQLRVSDFKNNIVGNLLNWTIKIYYQIPSSPVNATWLPITDLYTDPGATTAYTTGTATSVVYLNPSTPGTKNYTATLTNGSGCSVSASNSITVNPTPQVSVSADYCTTPGKVHLTATANPTGTYLWNTGATTQSIDVDLADDYAVTVTTAKGCSNTGVISISRELVVNGDFEAGNDGSFTSDYLYIPDGAGNSELIADNDNRGYSITTNGQNVHTMFWGFDHTTGSGNFMAVNGHDGLKVWKQTVDVLPNTTYYFSAWGRSLNNVSPFAKLQFSINGTPVGTVLNLPGRPNDSDPAHDNWQRFYGTWTSGVSTNSIILEIINLEGQHGGNDFAIDDISFATLSTFITLATPPGTDAQEVCTNTPISQIIYNIGNGAPSAPTISGLPAGVSATWDQDRMIITGSPTTAGSYTYSIQTTGSCNPKIATGTIVVNEQKVMLSNGAANTMVCINESLPTITYHLSGKATGATITGLPAGVTFAQSGNDINITGTPSIAGTFNYTITTTGSSCASDSKNGIITVQTQSIASTSGDKDQTLCISTPITNIVFTISGTASNATVSGLPAGLTMIRSGQQFIISGSPSISGSFTYTVTTSGTCTQTATISGTLNITPAAVGGSITSNSSACNGSGSISLSGHTGTVQRWQSSNDYGVIWTDISNTSTTENYTGVTTPRLYRAIVNNGCGEVASAPISVGRHNYWIGKVSTDWNNPANWSDNLLPSTSCPDVYIPASTNYQPILSSGSAQVNNIVMENGAQLAVTNDALLQVQGSFTVPGIARIDMSDGTLELNGSAAQTIPANIFVSNNVKDLRISNNAGVTMTGAVDIYNSVKFGSTNATLNTNGHLTLKSTKQNTAWIGPLTSSQHINDAVTVERYINTGTASGEHAKAWQLVAFPTTGQTIKNAIQEGATNSSQNPNLGFGIQVTGNYSDWSSRGFDAYSQGASMKVYNSNSDGYDGIPNTNNTDIHNDHGYFLFIRGDRTVTSISQPANNVVLRNKGILFTPANLGAGGFNMPVKANKFESVGNPYASAIDLRKLTFNNISSEVIVWDPTNPVGTSYDAGKYQTLTFDGTNYVAVPAGGVFTGPVNFIQSGQAFFVQSNSVTDGNLNINENAKSDGSTLMMRPEGPTNTMISIRSNLYLKNDNQYSLMDGTLSFLDDAYSNNIDQKDARKIFNSSENISVYSQGQYLVVERKAAPSMTDTIYFRMSNLRKMHYKLELVNANLSRSGLDAWLDDSYTNQKTLLNGDGITEYEFEVNSTAASYASNRFRIVFAIAEKGPLPVTFTDINAHLLDAGSVLVNWKVENESNIKEYVVERSADGIHFTAVGKTDSKHQTAALYQWLDEKPGTGYVYYRIRSVSADGEAMLSKIAKVQVPFVQPSITVYPNPVQKGVIQLLFKNQPAGKYRLRLTDAAGKLIFEKYIQRMDGNSIEKLNWDYRLTHGIYDLEIHKPDGGIHIIKVMY